MALKPSLSVRELSRPGCLLLAVFAITALRILYLAFYPYPLFADEAQYWFWSLTPDWGYYSKPPMVAWMIAATTWLLGNDGVLAVKLASPLAYAITSLVIYRLALRFEWPERTAFWCALLFLTMPGVTLSSGLISTDPFLLMFWALFMLCFWEARLGNQWRWWLATGLMGGLGLLSKYNMAFAALGVGLWALMYRRSLLASPRLYVGALLAALMFLPNILWNLRHGMVSLKHTEDITQLAEDGSRYNFSSLVEFIGAQIGLMGPLLFLGVIGFIVAWRRYKADMTVRFLLWLLVPSMAAILVLSFITRAHGNWAAPSLIPAAMLAVLWMGDRPALLKAALVLHLALMPVFYAYEPILDRAGVAMTKRIDPFYRLRGWDEAGRQVQAFMDTNPDATLLTDRRKISALMSYYAGPRGPALVEWQQRPTQIQDHFQLMRGIYEQPRPQTYLLVTPDEPTPVVATFRHAEVLGEVAIPIHDQPAIRLHIWRVEGFGE